MSLSVMNCNMHLFLKAYESNTNVKKKRKKQKLRLLWQRIAECLVFIFVYRNILHIRNVDFKKICKFASNL